MGICPSRRARAVSRLGTGGLFHLDTVDHLVNAYGLVVVAVVVANYAGSPGANPRTDDWSTPPGAG